MARGRRRRRRARLAALRGKHHPPLAAVEPELRPTWGREDSDTFIHLPEVAAAEVAEPPRPPPSTTTSAR
ncbi:MAG: hypothetical protein RL071_2263 [Pseudomonadota bacterium]